MPCSNPTTAFMFIGRGKSGKDNPWWAGGVDFIVSGNHESGIWTYRADILCANTKNISIKSAEDENSINFYINKLLTT